jgi:glucose-6-phosphate isomerase
LDVSDVGFPDDYLDAMAVPIQRAFAALDSLEQGNIGNADQQSRVGHYWLREPGLAPEPGISEQIEAGWATLANFVDQVRQGTLPGLRGRIRNVIHIGVFEVNRAGAGSTGPVGYAL